MRHVHWTERSAWPHTAAAALVREVLSAAQLALFRSLSLGLKSSRRREKKQAPGLVGWGRLVQSRFTVASVPLPRDILNHVTLVNPISRSTADFVFILCAQLS